MHANHFQTVFDPVFITLYNVIYTSLPVMAMGVFDQVCHEPCSVGVGVWVGGCMKQGCRKGKCLTTLLADLQVCKNFCRLPP